VGRIKILTLLYFIPKSARRLCRDRLQLGVTADVIHCIIDDLFSAPPPVEFVCDLPRFSQLLSSGHYLITNKSNVDSLLAVFCWSSGGLLAVFWRPHMITDECTNSLHFLLI
jgi:hypothetical protein